MQKISEKYNLLAKGIIFKRKTQEGKYIKMIELNLKTKNIYIFASQTEQVYKNVKHKFNAIQLGRLVQIYCYFFGCLGAFANAFHNYIHNLLFSYAIVFSYIGLSI